MAAKTRNGLQFSDACLLSQFDIKAPLKYLPPSLFT